MDIKDKSMQINENQRTPMKIKENQFKKHENNKSNDASMNIKENQ